jgi:hypothetical protein
MLRTVAFTALVALFPLEIAAQPDQHPPAKAAPMGAGHAMGMSSNMSDDAKIKSAMSAAPARVAANAAIIDVGPNGAVTELRKGANGFTCMADNPATPGPDPMCVDANGLAWAQAWMQHKTPAANQVGFIYMLAGGTDASNVDPFAEKPTAENSWISTGPHVMVVGAMSMMRGYPEGPNPDTSEPYVMWAGTPYAHLMIPVR